MDAKTLYPDCEEHGSFRSPLSYTPIIKGLGEVLVREDSNDYQGDTYALLKKGRKYGLIIFGWGSCSGCDALQACNTWNDLQDLIDSMERSVQWFDGKGAARKYFDEHDWEGDYSWHYSECKRFVERCKEILK
jgi:hypothetical protein